MIRHLPRFFLPGEAAVGQRVQLGAAEAKHVRVRRLSRGDEVVLIDGRGSSHRGCLEDVSRGGVAVQILEALPDRDGESALDLTLAVAVLKADRLDWVVEKATELGVRRIRPFTSGYSLSHPSAARQERWRQIALSAAKQSSRSAVPRIDPPTDLDVVLKEPDYCRLLFWEQDAPTRLPEIAVQRVPGQPLMAIVGPEGGFTAAEVEQARAAGAYLISLGSRVLRAETAALTAVALCQHCWGDLMGGSPHLETLRDRR